MNFSKQKSRMLLVLIFLMAFAVGFSPKYNRPSKVSLKLFNIDFVVASLEVVQRNLAVPLLDQLLVVAASSIGTIAIPVGTAVYISSTSKTELTTIMDTNKKELNTLISANKEIADKVISANKEIADRTIAAFVSETKSSNNELKTLISANKEIAERTIAANKETFEARLFEQNLQFSQMKEILALMKETNSK